MSSGEQLHGMRHVMRQASHDPFSVDGKGQEPQALSDVAQIPNGSTKTALYMEVLCQH